MFQSLARRSSITPTCFPFSRHFVDFDSCSERERDTGNLSHLYSLSSVSLSKETCQGRLARVNGA